MIDQGEINDIFSIFGQDAYLLSAIIIGHEMAHHVQHLNTKNREVDAQSGIEFELQADCAAGWSLRSPSTDYSRTELIRQLPRLLGVLNQLSGHVSVRDMPAAPSTHGNIDQRIAAMTRGMDAADVSVCGSTVTP